MKYVVVVKSPDAGVRLYEFGSRHAAEAFMLAATTKRGNEAAIAKKSEIARWMRP